MSEQLRADEFLENTRLQEVKNYYIDTFDKVYKLETDLLTLSDKVDNLDLSGYLPVTGQTLTGALKFNLANQEIKLISNSVNYISNNASNSIIYNNPTQYMKLGSGSSIDNSYLYSVKLNDYNYWYVNSNLTFFYYSPYLNCVMNQGPQITAYLNSNNGTQTFDIMHGDFKFNAGSGKFNVYGGVQRNTDYYYHIYANDGGTKRIGLYTASYDKTNNKETYGEFLIYGDSTNKFLEYSGNKFNNSGTAVGSASLWLDDTFTVSGNRVSGNSTITYSLTLGSSLVINGGIDHITSADYDGRYNFNISTSEASIYDNNQYGFTFKYNPVTNKYGIEPKNKTGNNKKNFTIEGFHNIINDKFTLSSDYDTSTLSEPLTQDEIAWINDNGKDILAMIISLKRSLDNNSEEEIEDDIISSTKLVTKPNTSTITLELNQNENNALTIDWGDSNIENTDGKSNDFTLTHTYETAGIYTIGISLNSETAEVDTEGLDTNQFTSMQIYKLNTLLANDNSVNVYKVNTPSLLVGSGNPLIQEANALTELVIGELAQDAYGVAYNCPNLTKATLQINENFDSSGGAVTDYIFDQCPNLTEIHITSTIPFDGSMLMDTENIPTGLVIYVPSSAVDTYKSTASWSAFTSYIQGE